LLGEFPTFGVVDLEARGFDRGRSIKGRTEPEDEQAF
jgi:hypothetical protein